MIDTAPKKTNQQKGDQDNHSTNDLDTPFVVSISHAPFTILIKRSDRRRNPPQQYGKSTVATTESKYYPIGVGST